MLGKTDKNPQLNIGEIPLVHFINRDHELCRLAEKINWEMVEKDFAGFYSSRGAPSIHIRTMVGLILLKKVYRFSDKGSIGQWLENPYWQHFCGEVYFQHKAPLYHSDFSHFRQRIGQEGENKIQQLGVAVFGQTFIRGKLRSERRHLEGEQKNRISKVLNELGSFLIKVSTKQ